MGDNFLRYLSEMETVPEPLNEHATYDGVPFVQEPTATNYKQGGKVRKKSLKSIAKVLQSKGRNGDTILAHINPVEAEMLKAYGGSGTRNPETGQPEFFFKGVQNFFKNPFKTIGKTFKNPKRTIADALGLASAVFGGPIGGAIGGAARSAIRGDGENPLMGALQGGMYGYGVPAVAGLAGQGLSKLGAEAVGSTLSNYAANSANSLFGTVGGAISNAPGAGVLAGGQAIPNAGASAGGQAIPNAGVSAGGPPKVYMGGSSNLHQLSTPELAEMANRQGYMQALTPKPELSFLDKTKNFLMKPKTMLSAASLGMNAYGAHASGKEAKKARQEAREYDSPEARADRNKRYKAAMKLSPEEVEENNKYLSLLAGRAHDPIDLDAINETGRYRREHSPEEHERDGRWFSYYDNPQFEGTPAYKEGGDVSILEVIRAPLQVESRFIGGNTGGQDDEIPAKLSDGEYVIDASTVSDLGDGNSKCGAQKLDTAVKKIRKHKRGGKLKLPPKAKTIVEYIGGK